MATLATPAEKKGQQVPEEKGERKPRPRVDDKFKIFSGTLMRRSLMRSVTFWPPPGRHVTLSGRRVLQVQRTCGDVFVLQSTCRPVDEHLMELLLMIDALKEAGPAHHCRDSVLRLCFARTAASRGCRSSKLVADRDHRGCRSRLWSTACAAVAGVFQHSGGSIV